MLTIFSSIRLVGSQVRAQVNLAHHHQVNYVLKSILNTGIKCWLLQMVVRVSIVGQRGRWAHVSPLRQLFSKFFWLFTKLMHKIQTTYTITHHVIPNTYLLDKKPLLQHDKVPNIWNPQKDYKWEGPSQAVNASTEGITSQTWVDDIIWNGGKPQVSHCNKSVCFAGQL